jgi:hypothetical protein
VLGKKLNAKRTMHFFTERNIVNKVHKAKLRHLDDGNAPQETASSKVEEADTRGFPAEIL